MITKEVIEAAVEEMLPFVIQMNNGSKFEVRNSAEIQTTDHSLKLKEADGATVAILSLDAISSIRGLDDGAQWTNTLPKGT